MGRNQFGITEDDLDDMRAEFNRRQSLSKEERNIEDLARKKEIEKQKKEQRDKLKSIEITKEKEKLLLQEQANNLYEKFGISAKKPIDSHFSMSYIEYLDSKLWSKIRRRILKRDNNICQLCGKKANSVHHRSYAYEVIIGEGDNQLISLCNKCHTDIEFDQTKRQRSVEEKEAYLIQQLKKSNK